MAKQRKRTPRKKSTTPKAKTTEALKAGAGIVAETNAKGETESITLANPPDAPPLLPSTKEAAPLVPKRDYSQFGEQEIIMGLLDHTKESNVAVELGARVGEHFSNIAALRDIGWEVHFFDRNGGEGINELHITAENIGHALYGLTLINNFGVLSIDLDGNDYWILKALFMYGFLPTVVTCEFNPFLKGSQTIAYNPDHVFDKTRYFGASFDAMCNLLRSSGYKLQARTDINIIAARGSNLEDKNLSHDKFKSGWGPDKLNREWVEV